MAPGAASAPRRAAERASEGDPAPRTPALSSASGGRGSRAAVLAAIALGAAMPVVQPLDNALFFAINGLGDGPEWLYQALDPHTRNYILLLAATVIARRVVCGARATWSVPRSASCWAPTWRARPSRS